MLLYEFIQQAQFDVVEYTKLGFKWSYHIFMLVYSRSIEWH